MGRAGRSDEERVHAQRDAFGLWALWTATSLATAVAGLFVAGLGLATLFRLILDRGISLSRGQPDLAMSRASLFLGVAIGAAPFLLGALDSVVCGHGHAAGAGPRAAGPARRPEFPARVAVTVPPVSDRS